ncbi:hypothetical protein L798_12852 [Zootermopsis nevadensis]|uniref:DUF4795 domain-containing protein n=1 Tax=Zootermopsis nevadensis TaxID=136037 RepID=A0A067QTU2_ZOONE|nr:hypothetical protein L798_12852 [Zootermopsis nevadensis]
MATGGENVDVEMPPLIYELFKKVEEIEDRIDNLGMILTKLVDGFSEEQDHNVGILEQIGTLKTTKADKEDVREALALKGDEEVLNEKVSLEQVLGVSNGLSKTVQDVHHWVSQQENVIQQFFADAERKIEIRMNEYFASRFKALENRLNVRTGLRATDAAMKTSSLSFQRNRPEYLSEHFKGARSPGTDSPFRIPKFSDQREPLFGEDEAKRFEALLNRS